MTSIRVKPAQRSRSGRRSYTAKIIEAQHCRQQGADNSGDGETHRNRDHRNCERDEPLHHQARLLIMDIGGLERHRRELRGLLTELQQVDSPSREYAGGGERPGEAAAALSAKRGRFDRGGSSEIAERILGDAEGRESAGRHSATGCRACG